MQLSAEKALREFEQDVDSGEDSKLASTTEDNRSPILDSPGECEVDSDGDVYAFCQSTTSSRRS